MSPMKETSKTGNTSANRPTTRDSDSRDTGMFTGPTSGRPRFMDPSMGMQMSTTM